MEEIRANGHKNVLATHPTTIEITKDDYLSLAGSCIVAINADKAFADFPPEFINELRTDKKFNVTLKAGDLTEKFSGYGHPDLKLEHVHDIVFRKSDFNEDTRTMLINCTKSAKDLSKKFIEKIKNPEQEIVITIELAAESK